MTNSGAVPVGSCCSSCTGSEDISRNEKNASLIDAIMMVIANLYSATSREIHRRLSRPHTMKPLAKWKRGKAGMTSSCLRLLGSLLSPRR